MGTSLVGLRANEVLPMMLLICRQTWYSFR